MAMSCAGRENNTHATDGCGLFSALLCGGCLHEITTPFFVSFDIFLECFFPFFYLAAASHPAASSKAPKKKNFFFYYYFFFFRSAGFIHSGENKERRKSFVLALPFLRTFENVFFFFVVVWLG
jgi:hypothetical protein